MVLINIKGNVLSSDRNWITSKKNNSVNETIEETEMQNGILTYHNFTNKLNEIQTE